MGVLGDEGGRGGGRGGRCVEGGLCFVVVAEALFAGADGALEGRFVYDALVGQCFEDGFVLLALAALLFGLCLVPPNTIAGSCPPTLFRQRPISTPTPTPTPSMPIPTSTRIPALARRPTQPLPGPHETDPVPAPPQHFDPVAPCWAPRGEEDGIAVEQAREASGVVGVAEELLGRGLQQGVHEEERVQRLGQQGVVGEGFVGGEGRGRGVRRGREGREGGGGDRVEELVEGEDGRRGQLGPGGGSLVRGEGVGGCGCSCGRLLQQAVELGLVVGGVVAAQQVVGGGGGEARGVVEAGEEGRVVAQGALGVLAQLAAALCAGQAGSGGVGRLGGGLVAGGRVGSGRSLGGLLGLQAVEGGGDEAAGHGQVDAGAVEQQLRLERAGLVGVGQRGLGAPVAVLGGGVVAGGGQGVGQVAGAAGVVVLEDARQGAGAQGAAVGRALCHDGVEGIERGALRHHAAGDLLVEKVDVLGLDVAGAALQHQLGHVLERAGALHRRHARRNLVEPVRRRQLARRQLAHPVLALPAQCAPAAAAPIAPIAHAQRRRRAQQPAAAAAAAVAAQRAVQGGARQAARRAHGQRRGLVDVAADLEQVVEDGGVNGPWARGQVVCVRQRLEHLGRQLQPRPVERRDVAPVPARISTRSPEGGRPDADLLVTTDDQRRRRRLRPLRPLAAAAAAAAGPRLAARTPVCVAARLCLRALLLPGHALAVCVQLSPRFWRACGDPRAVTLDATNFPPDGPTSLPSSARPPNRRSQPPHMTNLSCKTRDIVTSGNSTWL